MCPFNVLILECLGAAKDAEFFVFATPLMIV